jgi:hypothetical protein
LSQTLFLPRLLESRAESLLQIENQSDDQIIQRFDGAIGEIEENLQRYRLNFPLFSKVDAWKAPEVTGEAEVWILERMGWGNWKKKNRLLYVIESVSIPPMEGAEVLSVNSNSPPYLSAAKPIEWDCEILPDEVQAVPLKEAPPLLKEKSYPYLPEFLFFLSETLDQMALHHLEFADFMEEKVEEFVKSKATTRDKKRRSAIEEYFQTERRAELFMEFLQLKQSQIK